MKNLNLNSLIGVGNVIQTTLAPFQSQKVIENKNQNQNNATDLINQINNQVKKGRRTSRAQFIPEIPIYTRETYTLKRRFATPYDVTDDEYLDFLLGIDEKYLNAEELRARELWVWRKSILQEEARLKKLKEEKAEENRKFHIAKMKREEIENEKYKKWILDAIDKLKKTGIWDPPLGPNGEKLTKDILWNNFISSSNLSTEIKSLQLKDNSLTNFLVLKNILRCIM